MFVAGHQEEKIFIQLDTEPQHFEYETEQFLLNRFEGVQPFGLPQYLFWGLKNFMPQ